MNWVFETEIMKGLSAKRGQVAFVSFEKMMLKVQLHKTKQFTVYA